jgi:phosphoserine phosphatase
LQGATGPACGLGEGRTIVLTEDDGEGVGADRARSTILVRVSGRDRPGITAGLMDLLSQGGAELIDVEQVVVRGRLNLGCLIRVPEQSVAVKDLVFYGWERGLQIDFEVVAETEPGDPAQSVVTVIAPEVGPEAFGAVARAIAAGGGNIDRIARLSTNPVVSYELAVSGGTLQEMRRLLGEAASAERVDIAIQAEGLYRRAKRLVVLDVDSTLIQNEVIDLLAEEAGVLDEVQALTAEAMAGESDFEEALRKRVALLAGLDAAAVDRAAKRVRLTPGARTFIRTLKRLGLRVVIVSGGFDVFTDRLRTELGLDGSYANQLEIEDGVVTGRVVGQVVDRSTKAALLRKIAAEEGIPLAQTVAIGDGANDIDMLAAAGLGIAFNAKPAVREAADTSVSVPYLDAILFLLGIRREDIERADASD